MSDAAPDTTTETPAAPRRRATKAKPAAAAKPRTKAAKAKPADTGSAPKPARRTAAAADGGPAATVKRAATATRRVARKASDDVRHAVEKVPAISGTGIAVGAAVVAVGAIAGAAAVIGRERLTKAKDDLVDAVKTTGKKVAAAVPTRGEIDEAVDKATEAVTETVTGAKKDGGATRADD